MCSELCFRKVRSNPGAGLEWGERAAGRSPNRLLHLVCTRSSKARWARAGAQLDGSRGKLLNFSPALVIGTEV